MYTLLFPCNFTQFYLGACTDYLNLLVLSSIQIPISLLDACAAACSSSMAGFASTSYYQYYDVFINHRGPDVKETFATPLYHSLTSSRLQVFLDKPELQVGHGIPSQIEDAIQVASVHIAIFSPRYAESKWCLNELLSMVKSGKPIIPVFYGVKPEHLRWTRWTGTERDGPYAKALHNHEEKKRYDIQTIQQWRKALSDVADISGLDLEAFKGDKDELLDTLVQIVLQRVPPQLDEPKYPTGLEEKLEEFERTVLSQQQAQGRVEAKVVGIVGLGGVGKTTLAKHFLNLKRSNYKGSSFLSDVREKTTTGNLNSLQSKLIKDLKNRDIKIEIGEDGIGKLKNNLSSCYVIIILDDVDHICQLDAFLPIKNVLNPNSLILVTTRDRRLLTSASILEPSIYHLRGLSRSHSQQLFCSHAFSRPDPLPGFENLVEGFIESCDGLPLSLAVLGALLCGENEISYWEGLLDGLNKLLPDDIKNRLRISYDSLNEQEQQIFLDIACFCIGDDRDKWISIWDGSGWKGFVGFRNLQNKCLVEMDSENKIRMHDHLRDMGRNIADSSRSVARRLWQPINNLQHIHDLLEQSAQLINVSNSFQDFLFNVVCNTLCYNCLLSINCKQVITEVRGFRMAPNYFTSPSHTSSSNHEVPGVRKLQLLEANDNFVESILTRVQSPKLIWLCWHGCPCSSLPSWIPMQDLRILEVDSMVLRRLWESESAPSQLRELIIEAPLVEFPESLGQLKHLEKIVAMMTTSQAKFPKEFNLPSLKYLRLYGCESQQLWQCESQGPQQLRELIIAAPLVKFPKSLGQLKHLERIEAVGTFLETFPEEFNLPSLKYLTLDGCCFTRLWQCDSQGPVQLRELVTDARLVEFPKSLGQLKDLEMIVAWDTLLPRDFSYPPSLKYLELYEFQLEILPDSQGVLRKPKSQEYKVDFYKTLEHIHDIKLRIGSINENLTNLRRFKLYNFYSLKRLPNFLGNLTNLQHIDLSWWNCLELKGLPEFLGNLTNLQHITLSCCQSLKRLPIFLGNLRNLQHIDLAGCRSLKRLPNSLGNLTNLQRINLSCCQSLEKLPDSFGNLLQLDHLHLKGCCSLTISSETLGNIRRLVCLDLEGCIRMEVLPPQVGRQQSLEKLNLLGTDLKQLPSDLASLSSLEFLRLGSPLLEMLPSSLGRLTSLKELWLHECEKLQYLPNSVELLSQLTELKIWKCGIQYLPPTVMKMNNLKVLAVCSCPLRHLPFKRKSLEFCPSLPLDSSIDEGMFQLQELQLYRTEVSEVSFPQGVCPNLQDLRIVCCEHLVEVGALPTTLKNLDLRYCGALRRIRGIYGVAKLEKLDMRGCYSMEVEELQGLETLVSSGLELLMSQTKSFEDDISFERTESFEDDFSFERNVLGYPFCTLDTDREDEDEDKSESSESESDEEDKDKDKEEEDEDDDRQDSEADDEDEKE